MADICVNCKARVLHHNDRVYDFCSYECMAKFAIREGHLSPYAITRIAREERDQRPVPGIMKEVING